MLNPVNWFEFLVGHPIVLIGVVALPLCLLAWLRQTYPSRRLLWMAILPTGVSLLTVLAEPFLPVVVVVDLLLLALFASDLIGVPRARHFSVERRAERTLSLGKQSEVELRLVNRTPRHQNIELTDDCPDDFRAEPATFQHRVPPLSQTQFTYRLRSTSRGRFFLNQAYLKVRSRLGYWVAYHRYPLSTEIHVYPDLKQIAEYGTLARTNRLSLLGVRRARRIGQDNEFERLRDYTRDDHYRHVDWRATARKRKLIVRDFQVNQNQNLIFLVDCGRMMTGLSGKITLLDHALNAMLLMSYVALKQGDSVGLLTFSDRVHSYSPPRSGSRHLNHLLHQTFNQHAAYVESRFDEAFFYLNRHCRKRSLVVLLTNVIDEINANQVSQYLTHLTGQHLPLGVFLRDHDLFGPVEEFVQGEGTGAHADLATANYRHQLFSAAAAAEMIRWRHQHITALSHSGVLCIDAFPEQLTSTLVNRYLEIKARHLL